VGYKGKKTSLANVLKLHLATALLAWFVLVCVLVFIFWTRQESRRKMCHRCQNIYDCPAKDISKKQRGTELLVQCCWCSCLIFYSTYFFNFPAFFPQLWSNFFQPCSGRSHCSTILLQDRRRYP